MSPDRTTEHTDVGAYALGLLEEPDRRAFEAHLRGCPRCRAELVPMAGVADALRGLEPEETGDGEPPAELLGRVRDRQRADRRSRRGTYVIGTVAAATLLATGAVAGTALGGGDAAPVEHGHAGGASMLAGDQYAATDPKTGVSGEVELVGMGWGTQVSLQLKGVRGPLRCRLEAVSRTGERSVVTGWAVPPKGYGVPGAAKPALVTMGGTATPLKDIDRLEVRTDDGGTLLRVPVTRA
ncbi:zf-HC2 domain-containing protein [Actinomadura parmotrematis]|uniref:Zf-HC2 domain-containing protein n=1 Tax=Actinomadura parmotrematis TaxID=2864039 RepID=A0ABS7G0Q4_9ACTN|nr:zf-HC2 domain-containing protein [Actinomadura parmotrematis]MBW8486273.1 zf-HC2 domain-containing protein [Actinomadura parmotrematis]